MTNDPKPAVNNSDKEAEIELRRLVDAGLRKVTNSSLVEVEKISGPLTRDVILVYASIGMEEAKLSSVEAKE